MGWRRVGGMESMGDEINYLCRKVCGLGASIQSLQCLLSTRHLGRMNVLVYASACGPAGI